MIELISELERQKVSVFLDDGDLKVSYEGEKLDAELLDKVRENKLEIITFLKKYAKSQAYEGIPLTKQRECYALSPSQYRIWLLCSSDEVSVTYNVPNHFTLEGTYDVELLKKAIESVVDRHETLRTVFKPDKEEEIKQWILSRQELGFKVSYFDYRNSSDGEKRLKLFIDKDSVETFDFEKGPLIRVSIFHLKDERLTLYCNMHHIISDTWSIEVLINDILKYYKAFIKDEEPDLPLLGIQYKDYAAWQKNRESNDKFREHEKFWIDQFSGEIPVLDLPSYRPRPKVKTYNGLSLETYLSEEVTSRLNKYCQENGLSLFMGLLAIWNVLFYRYTGGKDLIIGTAVAGRDHLDLKDQVGCFINTVALRNRINPDDDFDSFCQKIKNNTLLAFEHQEYPFDKLVSRLQLKRDLSRGILFDVMFLLQNAIENNAQLVLEAEQVGNIRLNGNKGTVTDIDITFREEGKYLKLDVVFNEDVYDQSMIEGIMRHFKRLAKGLLDNKNEKITKVKFLSEEEKNAQSVNFNEIIKENKNRETLVDLFNEQVTKTPDNCAVAFADVELTFLELQLLSSKFANYLIADCKIEVEDLVGIKLDRSEWFIISLLGVLKAGAAYVPIDPNYPEQRIAYIESDSNCKVVIDKGFIDSFLASKINSPVIPDVGLGPDNLAYVIYTSGSTGKPKGVMIQHQSVVNLIHYQSTIFSIDPSEKILNFSNYAFDASVEQIFLSLLKGATLVVASSEDTYNPSKVVNVIEKHGITHFHATPSYLKRVKKLSDCKSLRRVVAGGEFCSIELAKKIGAFTNFYNEYGPTETTVTSLVFRFDSENSKGKVLPIGKPISNTEIFVLSEEMQLLPFGVIGELCISGDGLSRGYLNREELTQEKFVSHPFREGARLYKTGDLVRWLPDKNIEFVGRKDDQVKINGYRIELGEVENALLSLGGVSQAVAVVKEQEEEKFIISFLSGESLEPENIRKELLCLLPEYMVPKQIIILDEIPLTSNGKVDKKTLLSKGVEEPFKVKYLVPKKEEEKILVQVSEEVLDVQKIGLLDSFYNLGGDSIKSIQLVSKLSQKGYQLKVQDILMSESFQELSTFMKVSKRLIDQKAVVGDVPLTPIQLHFFENPSFGSHSYFNQSVVLKSKNQVDSRLLNLCLEELVKHHDALRMVFKKSKNGWSQYNKEVAGHSFSLHVFDLLKEDEPMKQMAKFGSNLQSSFNLEDGPLFKVGHFKLPDGDRIALISHHLVIDGVSWRILLEDLSLLYKQSLTNKKLNLPNKTDSFQRWSRLQSAFAESGELKVEAGYWQSISDSMIPDFPKDIPSQRVVWEYDAVESVYLDKETIELVQTKVYQKHKIEITDILLTGLIISLGEILNIDKVLVLLEGHGRENIIDDVDISRTVGWFTSLFPFLLEDPAAKGYTGKVNLVKEKLNQIPNKGIGYGILKYLSGQEMTELLPSIEFNYLGDFGSKVSREGDSVFEFASEDIGSNSAASNGNTSLLSVLSMISFNELHLSIRYSKKAFREETVKRLADSFKIHLENIILDLTKGNLYESLSIAGGKHALLNFSDNDSSGKVEISENQKWFIKSKQSHGIIGPIQLPEFSKINFEEKFRLFMKLSPFLSVEFELVNGKILQKSLPAEEFELNIHIENVEGAAFDIEALEDKALGYFHEPYDIFQGELMRLFVVDAAHQGVFLFVGIHHALTDMYTNQIIAKNLQLHFNNEGFEYEGRSNFEFSLWQKRFLKTKKAEVKNRFWVEKLQNIRPRKGASRSEVFADCISEKVVLSGIAYEKLKSISKRLNLPLNAVLLSAYQDTVHHIAGDDSLIWVIVDGRNHVYEDYEMNEVLGMISNFLPIPVISSTNYKGLEYIKKVYTDYVELLAYQAIPYEWIRKEHYSRTKIDLDDCIAGIFNYQVQNRKLYSKVQNEVVSQKEIKSDYTKGVDLTCVVYSNAIEITLTSQKKLYNFFPELSLNSFLNHQFFS